MITIQFGQYGNQIAPCVLDRLFAYSAQESDDLETFFRETPKSSKKIPRAILIDMEPKAIYRSCFNTPHQYDYISEQAIYDQSGSGNNWALGYHENGMKTLQLFKNKIRRELEKLDRPPAFYTSSSLAGGTGSGLGSYLVYHLKGDYPKYNILANAVMPFQDGEITVQDLNSVLSLASLQESADLLLLCANDEAAECIYKYTGNRKIPSLDKLNEIISINLAGQLAGVRPNSIFNDIVFSKFNNLLAARTSPSFPNDAMRKFPSVMTHLTKMCYTGSSSDYQMNWSSSATVKVLGGKYCVRGGGATRIIEERLLDEEKALQSSWKELDGFIRQHSGTVRGFEKSLLDGPMASGLVNTGCYGSRILDLCDSATKKCAVGAYIYRYEKFGVGRDDIMASTQQLRQLVSDYQ